MGRFLDFGLKVLGFFPLLVLLLVLIQLTGCQCGMILLANYLGGLAKGKLSSIMEEGEVAEDIYWSNAT